MANLLWTVYIIQLAYMAPSSRWERAAATPGNSVDSLAKLYAGSQWIHLLVIGRHMVMATRLIWFAKNSMQHNHDETVMSGMPDTPGGRS